MIIDAINNLGSYPIKVAVDVLASHAKKTSLHVFLRHYELSKVIDIIAIGLLANPKAFAKGMGIGLIGGIVEATFVFSLCLKSQFTSGKQEQDLSKNFIGVRLVTIIGPIQEELLYRFIIQRGTRWVIQKGFNFCEAHKRVLGTFITSKGILVRGYVLTAKHISIFVSSVLFVLCHDRPVGGLLAMFPSALVWGSIADSDGIICSIAAHIFHNSLWQLGQELPD